MSEYEEKDEIIADGEEIEIPRLSLTVPPCEALKIASREMPDNLTRLQLVSYDGEYCAVGWLAHCAGATDNELKEIDNRLEECDVLYQQIADYFGVDYTEYIDRMYTENDRAFDYQRNEKALENIGRIAQAIGCDLEVE